MGVHANTEQKFMDIFRVIFFTCFTHVVFPTPGNPTIIITVQSDFPEGGRRLGTICVARFNFPNIKTFFSDKDSGNLKI